jgi:hypothetical protein
MTKATSVRSQRAFLDRLGTPTAIRDYVVKRLHIKRLSRHAVSMWKIRGVPYVYRPSLIALAEERGVKVPAGFLL